MEGGFMKRAVLAALLAVSAAVAPAWASFNDDPTKGPVFQVFPNPYEPSREPAGTKIHFQGIQGGCDLKIYNIAGRLVYDNHFDTPTDGSGFQWDAKNSNGDKIASGMYIYFIESGGDTRKGKLGIVR